MEIVIMYVMNFLYTDISYSTLWPFVNDLCGSVVDGKKWNCQRGNRDKVEWYQLNKHQPYDEQSWCLQLPFIVDSCPALVFKWILKLQSNTQTTHYSIHVYLLVIVWNYENYLFIQKIREKEPITLQRIGNMLSKS